MRAAGPESEAAGDAPLPGSRGSCARVCAIASGLHARLAIFALVATVPGLVLLLHAADLHRGALERGVRERLSYVARDSAETLDEQLEAARGLLTGIAGFRAVLEGDGPECSRSFAALLAKFPEYSNIGAIAPDGRLFCSAVPSGAVDLSPRRYFQDAVSTREFVVGEYAVGLVTKRPVLHLAYPSVDEHGALRAVVYVALDLSSFARALAPDPPVEGASVAAWSGTTVLASPAVPEQAVGTPMAPAVLAAARVAGRDPIEAAGPDGAPTLYAFAPLSAPYESRIAVGAWMPRAAAFAQTDRAVSLFRLAYAAVIFGALCVAGVLAEATVAARLRRLAAAARAVSEGGAIDARSGVRHGCDEIGRLAAAFDGMTAVVGHLTRQNRLLLESAGTGIFGLDLDGRVEFANPAACAMLGYSLDEMLGRELHALVHARHPDGDPMPKDECPVFRALAAGQDGALETTYWRKDGQPVPVESVARAIREHGATVGTVVTFRDVTERKSLQAQLVHAQKMEAIGRLAGGVAHDFNNLLTVVLSIGNFLADELPADHPLARDVHELVATGQRGAQLTRRLLAFSRKDLLEPTVVAIDEVVGSLERMVQRVIGSDVQLRVALDARGACVRADPGQVEQALLNLVVNARDAMPRGGLLTIETSATRLNRETIGGAPPLPSGPYVVVAVSDTGVGMDAATQAHLFEPFFTTKAAGSGTGLGLSTVYGIVKQSGGDVRVYSTPGKGSTFRIYLPAASAAAAAAAPALTGERCDRPGAVLLVDDDPNVRAVVARTLRSGGHRVVDVASPAAALAGLEDGAWDCDLLLTDVVMPGMSGLELARQVRAARPDVRILLMSGHAASVYAEQQGAGTAPRWYLAKPFAPRELLAKVAQVLRERPASSA